jgi:hypothetical protein
MLVFCRESLKPVSCYEYGVWKAGRVIFVPVILPAGQACRLGKQWPSQPK